MRIHSVLCLYIITIGKRYDIVDQRIIGDVKYFVFIGDDGLKHVSSEENLFHNVSLENIN
jgi:hypothetical protein